MYITNAFIHPSKLLYLLDAEHPQNKGKAGQLALAGFTLAQPELLDTAIRQHIQTYEAVEDERGWVTLGDLMGPLRIITVVTTWRLPGVSTDPPEALLCDFFLVTMKPAPKRFRK